MSRFLFFCFLSFHFFCHAENTPSQIFLQKWILSLPFQGSILDASFWKQNYQEFLAKNPQMLWQLVSGHGHDQIISPRKYTPIWGKFPYAVQARFAGTNTLKDIQINFWNHGDANHALPKQISPDSEKNIVSLFEQFLKDCQAAGFPAIEKKQKFSSKVKIKLTEVILHNSLLEIHSEPGQYCMIVLKPFTAKPVLNPVQERIQSSRRTDGFEEKETLRENLVHNVVQRPNGDLIVESIPMIDQGNKGYCVPVTCTRVLRYYGFDTNEHVVAKLMGTTAAEGTLSSAFEKNIKKLSSGLPIYVKTISAFSFSSIERYVSRGYPLIWIIPGHCRLIIGVNPKTKEIIYSDSWGTRGIENRMDAKQAKSLTRALVLLK
jgi:hypothetical protein